MPLPDFLTGFCIQFKLVPAMLMPNTLIILRELYGFFSAWKIPWNQESIMSLITFTLKEPGSYYAQPKHSDDFKMIGIPFSRYGWKEKYVFVKSEQGWPINTIPKVSYKEVYKGWGITKRISRMLKAHGSKPFYINVETLEIIPAKEEKPKKARTAAPKRKTHDHKIVAVKRARVESESEAEAATGDSEGEEEESIQWSEETNPAAAAIKEVVKKVKKAPGIIIKEPTTVVAPILEEPTSAKGKEKVRETAAGPSTSSGYEGDTAGPDPIEKEASTSEDKEESRPEDEWEWHWSKKPQVFSMKKNNKYRFIPEMKPAALLLLMSGLFKHPEDDKALDDMNDHEVGVLQAHLSISSMILGQYLTERLMMAGHVMEDTRADLQGTKEILALHKELSSRFEKESLSLGSIMQMQDEDHKLIVKELKANEAFATKEVQKMKAEVERMQKQQRETEEKLKFDRAADVLEKDALKARVAELEEAVAQMRAKQTEGAESKSKWVEEYKTSEEYQYELKDVGSYGFNLLRRVLNKEEKLPTAELNAYDYDTCIVEDADGNIPD